MKKTIAILLACMTLVLCAVSAYAGYEIYDVQPQANCCSNFSGYATEILHHTKLGDLVSRNVSTTVHRVVEGSTSGQKQILCAHIEVLATSNAHITQTSITQQNGIPCIFVGNTIFIITTGVYHEEDFIMSFCYTMSVFAALLSIRQ